MCDRKGLNNSKLQQTILILCQISSKGTSQSPSEMGLEETSFKVINVDYELLLFSVEALVYTTVRWRRPA